MKYIHFLLIVYLFSICNCLAQTNNSSAESLINYRDKVYSILLTCRSHDEDIAKAINGRNIKAIESAKTALFNCSADGIKALNKIENFKGDPALKYSCMEVLKFYQQLSESDIPKIIDFFIEQEKFLNLKNKFKKMPSRKYSLAEIQSYNNEVKKYNEAVTRYAQLSEFLTAGRRITLRNWNTSAKLFMDAHSE